MKRHRVILPAALLLPLFWVPDGLAQSSVIAPAEPKLELVVQTGHSQLVGSVCLSYDGRWMVTGSYDKSAILWDTHSGRMLRVFKTGASNTSISLSRDGTRLATAAADYKAALWDTHTGKQLQTFPGVKDYGFDSLSLSGDGKRLAGTSKGDAYVWDTQTAKLVRKFDGPQDARHFRLALNHDGKRLVTGSGKTAILWNVDTGGKLQTFAGHTGFVGSVCLSDDGTRLATRAGDDVAILWDTESGKKPKNLPGAQGQPSPQPERRRRPAGHRRLFQDAHSMGYAHRSEIENHPGQGTRARSGCVRREPGPGGQAPRYRYFRQHGDAVRCRDRPAHSVF